MAGGIKFGGMSIGNDTFSAAGGAVADLYAAKGYEFKAKGNRLEAASYDRAAVLADQNSEFTKQSTAVKLYQSDRAVTQSLGSLESDIAGAGFTKSGSALDLLRDSASQGALSHQILSQQGLITEAGYDEQARAARSMADAARISADAADTAAEGANIGAGIKAATAIASLFM